MSAAHKLSGIVFKVEDEWLASLLLMSLPEYYDPMLMGLEASGTRLTADAVKAKILQVVSCSMVREAETVLCILTINQGGGSTPVVLQRRTILATTARRRDIMLRSVPRSRILRRFREERCAAYLPLER